MASRRVCLITTGHLSTCPRMLKAADALVGAGFDVHVVLIRSGGWAVDADARLRASRRWHAHVVSYERDEHPVRWAWSGVRQRAVRALVEHSTATRTRIGALTTALSRVAPEIVAAARAVEADFYYAGAAGALGLAALAADGRVPWAVDVEDAHGLEPLEFGDESGAERMRELESLIVRDAAFVTAAGEGVAGYYRDRYAIRPLVINNVFSLGARPAARGRGPLALYWFSQTIGPRRGLDVLIDSVARADVPATLTLRGRADEAFVSEFRAHAAAIAPRVAVCIEPPADPDEMVTLAARYDVGISLEDASIPHRAICTPNKLFVYLAAGLAVAASPTPGQLPVFSTAPDAFVTLSATGTSAFESALRTWTEDRSALDGARVAAWESAARRWRWDHSCERDALVARVREVVQ